MAKDPRNIESSDVVKKDIKKKQEKSDEKIRDEAKDKTTEQTAADNAARLEGMPTSGKLPKVEPVAPDELRPKPTIEPLSEGEERKKSARTVGTGRKKTTVLNFGTLPKRNETTVDADDEINLLDRVKSGMGIPGEEKGTIDRALQLHERDRLIAARTGKTVNDVAPNDPSANRISILRSHHHSLAKVMDTFKISDEDVYRNSAASSGVRFTTHIAGLHDIAQTHEDSKRQISFSPTEKDFWQHPKTGEVIPVSQNHPEMPLAFTRTKSPHQRVTRGPGGEQIVVRGHEGWDPVTTKGVKNSKTYLPRKAPEGVDLVDHLRAEMLNNHGSSVTSRKASADIATSIADAVSGRVPKGKKQIGVQKVVEETTPKVTSRPKAQRTKSPGAAMIYRISPTNKETVAPLLVDRAKPGKGAGRAPNPPLARTGKVLLGTAPLDAKLGPKEKTPVVTTPGKRQPTQPYLPGTGVPKTVVTETKSTQFALMEGPLTQSKSADLDLSIPLPPSPKGSAAEQMMESGEPPTYSPRAYAAKQESERKKRNQKLTEDDVRKVKVKNAEYTTSTIPTDIPWRPETSKGRQFAIDTTDMSGVEVERAIAGRGELASQKAAGTALELRPGGAKQAKRDRMRKPKTWEQPSLFPTFSAAPGRENKYYMAGSPKEISPVSRQLQGEANMVRGNKEVNVVKEAEDKVGVTTDSRAAKKLNKQLDEK